MKGARIHNLDNGRAYRYAEPVIFCNVTIRPVRYSSQLG